MKRVAFASSMNFAPTSDTLSGRYVTTPALRPLWCFHLLSASA